MPRRNKAPQKSCIDETSARTHWSTKVDGGGRVVVPAEVRRALGVKAGDTVVFEADGNRMLMRSMAEVVHAIQQKYMASWDKPGSAVDEFLADRNKMWGDE